MDRRTLVPGIAIIPTAMERRSSSNGNGSGTLVSMLRSHTTRQNNMSDYSFETLISRMAISILPQQNNPPSNLRFIQTHKHPTQHHLHLLITPTPISDSTPHLLSQIPLQDPSPRPFSNTLLHPPLQTQTFTNWKTRPVAPSPQRNVRVQTLGSSLEK